MARTQEEQRNAPPPSLPPSLSAQLLPVRATALGILFLGWSPHVSAERILCSPRNLLSVNCFFFLLSINVLLSPQPYFSYSSQSTYTLLSSLQMLISSTQTVSPCPLLNLQPLLNSNRLPLSPPKPTASPQLKLSPPVPPKPTASTQTLSSTEAPLVSSNPRLLNHYPLCIFRNT